MGTDNVKFKKQFWKFGSTERILRLWPVQEQTQNQKKMM